MEIKINEKSYKPSKPKAKAWRELMEFDETKGEIDFTKYVDSHIEIIVKSFADPELTSDMLSENLEVDEILDIYREMVKWFCELLSKKMNQLPNDQPTAE